MSSAERANLGSQPRQPKRRMSPIRVRIMVLTTGQKRSNCSIVSAVVLMGDPSHVVGQPFNTGTSQKDGVSITGGRVKRR